MKKLFREYPDQERIRKHHRTTYDKVRNEWLPEDKWLHLVSIFQGYFGIIAYPDLPEGTPVILPTGTEEDSLLSAVLRLPGAFLPQEDSPIPPSETSLSNRVPSSPELGRNFSSGSEV